MRAGLLCTVLRPDKSIELPRQFSRVGEGTQAAMCVVMMSDSIGFVTVTWCLFRNVLGLRKFGRLLCVLLSCPLLISGKSD